MNPPAVATRLRFLTTLALVAAFGVAACGEAASSPTPTPTPTRGPVTLPEQAAAAVIATDPRLTGIGPLDPQLIGQASWYEVASASGVAAFLVAVRVGWGDCQAGCIDEHRWVYAVQPDGSVRLQSEEGSAVPADAWPSPGGDGRTGLLLTAVAGPVCPVETNPPDPACAPRAVPGAVVVLRDATGAEVARLTLDDRGFAFAELTAGDYVVEAQPQEGLLGTPEAVRVTVVEGAGTPVTLGYDTGIR